jgi:hypothetical protein
MKGKRGEGEERRKGREEAKPPLDGSVTLRIIHSIGSVALHSYIRKWVPVKSRWVF